MSDSQDGGGPVVETEVEAGVGVIRLNRPQSLNAVNTVLVEQLVAAFDSMIDARVDAVVLTGRGRAFCAGHDLKAPTEDPATLRARLDRIQDVTRRIRRCPAPVIAAVRGHAVGAGAEFALGCDLVVAAEDAQFRFPEVGLGLSVTGGLSALLPMLVGPMRAKELVMFGEPIGAVSAHRAGLVNAVVAPDALLPTAMSWAQRLVQLPRTPLALAKEAMDAGIDNAVESALEREIEHAIRTEEVARDRAGSSRRVGGGHPVGDREQSLVDLVRHAAARWPERVAWTFDQTGEELTFADIDQRSDSLAALLVDSGVTAGDRVAVMMDNRPQFPLSWLATAKLGAAMVPVNNRYQEYDARHVLAHSGASVVLTTAHHTDLLARIASSTSVRHVLDVDAVQLPAVRALQCEPPVPEAVANIQYTSGTTGAPKGCVLPHRYWVSLAAGLVRAFPHIDARDTILTAQPFHYVDPQWNVALGLASGARLVVLDRFHPMTFWQKVREHGVTWFYAWA